jgi:hypothetical protein
MTFKKYPVKGRCHVKNCTNKAKGKTCSTCRSRKARAKDPVKYSFISHRNNAKRRGKKWTITLEQFREFCGKVKYIGFTGRNAEGYTLDRIREEEDYHIWNIQVLKNADNVKKYFSYDWQTKTVYEMKPVEVDSSDLPF